MSNPPRADNLLAQLDHLNAQQLRRLLVEEWSYLPLPPEEGMDKSPLPPGWGEGAFHRNLIIEGDNFDSLRLLKATHAGKIHVICIDPLYSTGNKDWVYNDHYVGANDRWRHSQWLDFLYRSLMRARFNSLPDKGELKGVYAFPAALSELCGLHFCMLIKSSLQVESVI